MKHETHPTAKSMLKRVTKKVTLAFNNMTTEMKIKLYYIIFIDAKMSTPNNKYHIIYIDVKLSTPNNK